MTRIYEHGQLVDEPEGAYYWQSDDRRDPKRSEPVHGHVWRSIGGDKGSWQCECVREDARRICEALALWDREQKLSEFEHGG